MNEANFKELLIKYQQGQCTAAEKAQLESWVTFGRFDGPVLSDEMLDERLAKLGVRLPLAKPAAKTVKLWPKIAAASVAWKVAAAVTAITLGIWLYYASGLFGGRHPELVSGSPLANDIAPGKNTATITLANGEIINLSDAKNGVVVGRGLRYNDGSAVANLSPSGRDGVAREGSSNSKVQTLTASTPRGGTYQITLPDGTRVWLNADSRISFPSQFSGKQRKILLSGEAYFEVSKNKRMPFIVESNGQQVEVLGTHFNINAYKDETSTKTTLLEGSVRVAFGSPSASRSSLPRGEMASAREGNTREGSIVLKPNQQSTISSDNQIKVTTIDPADIIDWKNGEFIFKRESLSNIMRKISRWYDIEIVFAKNIDLQETFSGVVSRSKNLSEVLHLMGLNEQLKFKISGRQVTVMK